MSFLHWNRQASRQFDVLNKDTQFLSDGYFAFSGYPKKNTHTQKKDSTNWCSMLSLVRNNKNPKIAKNQLMQKFCDDSCQNCNFSVIPPLNDRDPANPSCFLAPKACHCNTMTYTHWLSKSHQLSRVPPKLISCPFFRLFPWFSAAWNHLPSCTWIATFLGPPSDSEATGWSASSFCPPSCRFCVEKSWSGQVLKMSAVFMVPWYDNIWCSTSSGLDDSVPLAWGENLCCFLRSFYCRMHDVKLHVGVPWL